MGTAAYLYFWVIFRPRPSAAKKKIVLCRVRIFAPLVKLKDDGKCLALEILKSLNLRVAADGNGKFPLSARTTIALPYLYFQWPK